MLDGYQKRQFDGLPSNHHSLRLRLTGRHRLQQPIREWLQPAHLHWPADLIWRWLLRAPVEEIQARVRRDPIQPSPKRGAALETPAIAPRPQQRLLHQVLGLVERAQHPIAVHPQLPPIPLSQPSERRLVPSAYRSDTLILHNPTVPIHRVAPTARGTPCRIDEDLLDEHMFDETAKVALSGKVIPLCSARHQDA